MRARLAAVAPPAALFALGSVLLGSQSLRVHTFQPDEYIYLTQARTIVGRFPEALWDQAVFYLGFERVHELLQAAAIAVLPPADAFAAGKLIPAIAFASVSIPAWLLAQGLGLGRRPAAAAAAASVAVPWVALSTSFLNEPVAYPAAAWAAWGIWRAALRGGWRNDALAIVLIALAALSRSSLVVLAGALPLTVLLQELRFREARAGVRGLARGVLKRHAVLIVAGGAGLAWIAFFGGVDRARGYYSTSLLPDLGELGAKGELLGGMLAQGFGMVTFVLALAWVARTIARGEDRGAHAFAVVAVVSAGLVAYSAAAVQAHPEERYLFYVAPLVIVAAVAAIARRELPVALVAGAAVVTGIFVLLIDGFVETGPYDHLSSPGRTFWIRVILGRINTHAPGPLADHAETVAVVVLGAVAVGIALAIRSTGRAGRIAVPAALAAIVAFGVVTAVYNLNRFVDLAGAADAGSFTDRTFLDRTLGRDAFYKYLDGNGAPTQPSVWREVAFFNESFQHSYVGYSSYVGAADPETGAAPTSILEPFIVTIPQYRPIGLAARRIGGSHYLASRLDLFELEQPYQARWVVSGGVGEGGTMAPGARARIRVFGAGLPRGDTLCFHAQITSQAGTGVEVRGGSEPIELQLQPGGGATLAVPLPGLVERGRRDVRVHVAGDAALHSMWVRPCAR